MESKKKARQGGVLNNFDFDDDQLFTVDKDFEDLSLAIKYQIQS
jgi:hypothetical protein